MNHDYINQFNLIDQYVLGKLTVDEAEEFEDHFIDCPACVEQLNATRSFIQDLKVLAVQEPLLLGSKSVRLTRPWRLRQLVPTRIWVAIAFSCIVVAGVFTFFAFRRTSRLEAELRQAKGEASIIRQQYERGVETAAESERRHQEARQQLAQRVDELEKKLKDDVRGQSPVHGSDASEVNFPIYSLVSVARGQVPAPTDVAPPASSPRFAISIPVEDKKDFSVYRVTIVDNRGATVWKQSGFRPDAYHALSLSLNSDFLTPGTYDLRVEGLTPPNQWNTVGSYPFRFARRR
ncbi:MAG TPA: hypothetical protein VEW46_23290 [Pyrinomonadaceae bacterium]|nr:hypothetical protein [Pyrinomonadaceae bacterium]